MLPLYEIVTDQILYFPNALKDPKKVINFLETTESTTAGEWLPWFSHGDEDPYQYGMLKEITPHRAQYENNENIRQLATDIIEEIYAALDSCYLAYYEFRGVNPAIAETYVRSYKKDRPSHIAVKKYFDNEALGPHPDWEDEDPVVFTASMYFNDEYLGGELNFPEYGVSIKPLPGA